MNKYHRGKIYVLRNKCDDEIYVGSTTQPLYKRLYEHKSRCNKKCNFKLYQHMRKIGIDNYYIELYEDYSCDNIEQLRRREGEVMRELNATLNTNIAGRSDKEYQEANKDKLKAYRQAYREANKDKIKAYRKDNRDKIRQREKAYREVNKAKILEKQKEYREANKEKWKAYEKAYREANKDKIKAYRKKYYEAHKEQIKAYQKAYREANKEKK